MVSTAAVCAGGLFTCSAVLGALFIYSAVSLAKYSPVYRPMSCTRLPNKFGDIGMDAAWINISGVATKRCSNPNAYDMTISEKKPGDVYAKTETGLLQIGVDRLMPISFPSGGEAVGESRMQISMSTGDDEAMAFLMQPVLQVVTTIHAETSAAITFLGVSVASNAELSKICGFAVELSTKKVGPTECLSLDGQNVTMAAAALVIPNVSDSRPRTSLLRMDPEHLEAATKKKNMSLGGIMAVTGILALACFAGAIRALRRARSSASKDAREVNMKLEEVRAAEVVEGEQNIDAV